ncbi:hypothetical protein L4X63_05120 [Geomonas sp. Red32]|uniref:hypothetical protein n=1 Tax=Geomonas sp. Red32 TaxID=2912856 RepID=UPI00202CC2D9|nr:hypothetical protein [Geomonas sp. Red32]MCM0080966.1 hypothetical protein [Geomonas sp. Red32]
MKLEDDYKNKYSDRLFEALFAVVTGLIGGFFMFVAVWFGRAILKHGKYDSGSVVLFMIIFFISWWFLKLTYKLAFHKCEHLLSNFELRVTGWFFILFVPAMLAMSLFNHEWPNLKELIPCTPGVIYGFYALKVVQKRAGSAGLSDKTC